MGLICANQPLDEEHAIRAIHVRATNLSSMLEPTQHDIFGDVERIRKLERLDLAIDELRRRFGNKCVHRAPWSSRTRRCPAWTSSATTPSIP